MAAATAAVLSGTPVGTASRISWVSAMLDPRMEYGALGAAGPFGSGDRSITRVDACALARRVSKRRGGVTSAASARPPAPSLRARTVASSRATPPVDSTVSRGENRLII
jgi:hypothetical protein